MSCVTRFARTRRGPARSRSSRRRSAAIAASAVRSEAAVALADLRGVEALAGLLVAVEDDDPHVRQMAIAALGEIGDGRATQRLERALRDDRPEVRYQAIIAYARVVRDDGAAWRTRSPARSTTATRRSATSRCGSPRSMASTESLFATRASRRAPRSSSTRPIRRSRWSRRSYLARLGDGRGRSVVLDIIAERRRTPELEDEQACVELAGELPLREAIPQLERRIWGTRRVLRKVLSWGAGDGASCAWHARIALARLGHDRARAEILADLASWRRETREAAVVAAGRARMGEARGALESLGESVDDALVREALVRLAVG